MPAVLKKISGKNISSFFDKPSLFITKDWEAAGEIRDKS